MRHTSALRRLAVGALATAALATGVGPVAASSAPEANARATCGGMARPPATPTAYASAFLSAWTAGNRTKAGCLATSPVVQLLFADRALGGTWTLVSQESGEDIQTFRYRNAASASLVLAVDTYQSGWRKVYVAEEGRPIIGRVGSYVEKLVAAWRVGDKAAAGRYATPEVVASLWRTSGGPAGSSWTRLSSRAWTYNGVTVTYTSRRERSSSASSPISRRPTNPRPSLPSAEA